MNHFEFRDGEMFCEDVPLSQVAGAVGTPVYVYSSATLERHFTVLETALSEAGLKGEDGGAPLIAYAVKANPNLAVLATLARLGAGA
ncbi:MAG: diaminopimelate decarboxylase, partial [Phenylobacterium sp.]